MTVELLAQRGLRVRSEIARAYVDEEILNGRTIQEIRSDMRRFQCEILRWALASEAALPRDELAFFDRGVPDSLAYFMLPTGALREMRLLPCSLMALRNI